MSLVAVWGLIYLNNFVVAVPANGLSFGLSNIRWRLLLGFYWKIFVKQVIVKFPKKPKGGVSMKFPTLLMGAVLTLGLVACEESKDSMEQAAESATETTEEMSDAVADKAEEVMESAEEMGHDAMESAEEMADNMGEKMDDMADATEESVSEMGASAEESLADMKKKTEEAMETEEAE